MTKRIKLEPWENVRARRVEKEISLNDVKRAMKEKGFTMSAGQLSEIERGLRMKRSWQIIVALAEVLGCAPGEFFG